MSIPYHDICWMGEPFYAWDLWGDIPGGGPMIDHMLNGGAMLAPVTVSLYATKGMAFSPVADATAWDVFWAEPVISGDWPVVNQGHGLFTGLINNQDSFYVVDNDGEGPYEAMVQGNWAHVTTPGDRWELWRIQDVLLDFDPETDELPLTTWLHEVVAAGDIDLSEDPFKVLRQSEQHLVRRHRAQRDVWRSALEALSRRHECAEHLLADHMEWDGRTPLRNVHPGIAS